MKQEQEQKQEQFKQEENELMRLEGLGWGGDDQRELEMVGLSS